MDNIYENMRRVQKMNELLQNSQSSFLQPSVETMEAMKKAENLFGTYFKSIERHKALRKGILQHKEVLDSISKVQKLFTKVFSRELLADLIPSNLLIVEDDDFVFGEFDMGNLLREEEEEERRIILDESGKLKRIITDIFEDDRRIVTLEPRTFEEVIAELLRSQGYSVNMTKQTRDGGYDLVAVTQVQGNFPLRFLVECKRYKSEKIGVDIVRQLMYVVEKEKANKGIIATTSYFSADAKKEKEEIQSYRLDLRDKDDILKWIAKYCEEKLFIKRKV